MYQQFYSAECCERATYASQAQDWLYSPETTREIELVETIRQLSADITEVQQKIADIKHEQQISEHEHVFNTEPQGINCDHDMLEENPSPFNVKTDINDYLIQSKVYPLRMRRKVFIVLRLFDSNRSDIIQPSKQQPGRKSYD